MSENATLDDVYRSLISLHSRIGDVMGKLETIHEILKARDTVCERGARNTEALVSGSLFEPKSAEPRPVTGADPITDADVPF